MANAPSTERAAKIAEVFRPLGTRPLSRAMAKRAAQLLGVHWTSVYRLRRRYLAHPVASSLIHQNPGMKDGTRLIDSELEAIIEKVLNDWLPRQRNLAHPLKSIDLEVQQRCAKQKLTPPSRFTLSRRWANLKEAQADKLADHPNARIAPGEFRADVPLEMVQIDHTQADVFVVDALYRSTPKRPWISIAIDLATRCILGIYISFDRPNAAAVALLVTRIVFAKQNWLKSLGVDAQWPMHGMPSTLHLDNAAEFRGRALKSGCNEYGIKLMYRPVGRPQFGGHIERFNRTLMEKLKGLPGATGNSTKERRLKTKDKPEQTAALTLREFERWVTLEIAQRYHHTPHRGLMDATPAQVWANLSQHAPPRKLSDGNEDALRFLVHFLPLIHRTIQNDGLTLFRIRYWSPIFTTWRALRRQILVRYHPDDLSRLYVSINGKSYYEARYADLRRPRISLGEHRAVCKALRGQDEGQITEARLFKAIKDQQDIILSATNQKRKMRGAMPTGKRARRVPRSGAEESSWTPLPLPPKGPSTLPNYDEPADAYPAEIW